VAAAVDWLRRRAAQWGGDAARIVLIGHSSGGSHVASYLTDPLLDGHADGVVAAVLISARLDADTHPDNPNAAGVIAYYGADPSLQCRHAPMAHAQRMTTPLMIAVAEHENPYLDLYALQQRAAKGGALTQVETLRLDLVERINALGIGAQGLGGLTTVLDVKIALYPTHAASKPVAMIPNCAATRHARFVLRGEGAVYLDAPPIEVWPDIVRAADVGRRVDLNTLTPADVSRWRAGETLLLSGRLLTGRDAAHQRMQDLLSKGEALPVDLTHRVMYYVGPVDPVGDEAVGPAGPTTATRMDKFTEMMLEKTGMIAMIGKAERGAAAIASIRHHQRAYLVAVGGAAYLVSKAIRHARVVGFADLGMEAIYEFDVVDMPVTVAVDATGTSIHTTGPGAWQRKIADGLTKVIPLKAV